MGQTEEIGESNNKNGRPYKERQNGPFLLRNTIRKKAKNTQWVKNGPKNGPKMGQNLEHFVPQFVNVLVRVYKTMAFGYNGYINNLERTRRMNDATPEVYECDDPRFARGKFELMVNRETIIDLAVNDINLLDLKIEPPFVYFKVEYRYTDIEDSTKKTFARWRTTVIPLYAPYEPRIVQDGINAAYRKAINLVKEAQEPLNRGQKYLDYLEWTGKEEKLRAKYGNEWSLHLADLDEEG